MSPADRVKKWARRLAQAQRNLAAAVRDLLKAAAEPEPEPEPARKPAGKPAVSPAVQAARLAALDKARAAIAARRLADGTGLVPVRNWARKPAEPAELRHNPDLDRMFND